MFRRFFIWISHFWGLLCEFLMPSTPISQTPSTSVSDAMPSKTESQTHLYFVSCSTPTRYDVFLSFHGKDTRLNFTSHLYDKLESNGIRTFKDDPELRSGQVISDALLDAIRKSKTYIVVLSQNYAFSSWCLDELVEICNCHKGAERLVIPVFYKIDPSVVRHQVGSFKQAFKKHQVRLWGETEKVANWQLTLKKVAGFSGHHISEDRSEAHVINAIVDELLLNINPKTLDVTRYPVGLDSRVKAIKTMLSSGTKGVIVFGIYGMGGVGKTTLAKALYNQLLGGRSFKGSCFLANVREISGTAKGLVSLQEQLINDVLNSTTKVEAHNVDQGIKLIEARICSTEVLVVIDDLDDPKQFRSLVGPFASGSVVIITTRDEEILDKIEVEIRYRYMVHTLDNNDSLALFTRHAFGNGKPNDTLKKLSEDMLRLAGGLPLALEVFGSHLYMQPEVGWKYYIEKLQRNPNSNIQQRLVISLDALEADDPLLKKMFLDIACFFIGWGKQKVVRIMESYYSYPDHYIDVLKKRCLLTVDSNDVLRMHDLLQDMGREIAHNNYPDEPGKHSRLWVTKDICEVLKNHKGTEAIECIKLQPLIKRFVPEAETYTTGTFKRMSKLRFLYLINVNLTGSFEHILDDLRWLCWYSCPLECLPSDFYPQNLVILELRCSNMRTMWEVNTVSRAFRKLKSLDMSYSKALTTLDFSKLPCLETLDLSLCEMLEEVHILIGSLTRLVSLNLLCCVKLRSLPDTLCNLRALRVLIISACYSLEALPMQLGNITSLTELNAGSLNVSKLPDSIGCLSKLVKLNLGNNKKLETLPDTICNLRSLEILNIANCCSLDALPAAIGNIETLKEIHVQGPTVSKLPDSIGSLSKIVELDLNHDKKLETLPDTICNLISLEILNLSLCEKLEILPDELWKITGLRELSAFLTTQLKKIPDIGSGQSTFPLQKMDLSSSGITALPSGFSQLSNLQSLHLRGCNHLIFIPKLPSNLKRIDAYECESLERLPNLSNLKHLETLDLSNCRGLTEIDGLEELAALSDLRMTGCTGLTYIQGLDNLASIKGLQFGGCASLLASKHLTKLLFQIYCGFVHPAPKSQWPDWITESPYWTSESSKLEPTIVYAHLLPNESHKFMGIILCLTTRLKGYSVKNSTSGFIWRDSLVEPWAESVIVILPKSVFSITDSIHTIELIVDKVKTVGIHLLYKTETGMIDDVMKKHETTFDALKLVDPVLQDICLDIACFFIGWKKRKVVPILETYYLDVDHRIDILKKKCFLKINDQDELEMNDMLRHIGRKIASNNFLDEPGKHSRLWLSIDIYEVLKKHEGTEAIEGIVPRNLQYEDALDGKSFTTETFKMMSRIRFLCLKKVNLTGSFEKIFESLRWFCWIHCPLNFLPSDFYPQKLVTLELPNSNLRTMWELNMVPHIFENLKTLDMKHSLDLTATPDFTRFPCLEILDFKDCKSLEELDISVGSLVRLVSLNLGGCVKLKSLPHTICNLRALEVLTIDHCTNLNSLPTELGNIQSLTMLSAYSLTVSKLPISISRLGKLVELHLSGCKYLDTLPHTICNLRALEVLNIHGCSSLEALPMALGDINSIKELYMEKLTVSKLPDSIGHLSKLVKIKLNNNKNLETLPDTICNLRSLEILDISGCEKLEMLPDQLWKLNRLTELYAGGATLLKILPDIESRHIGLSLKKLDLSESLLTSLPSGFSQLSNLKDLNFSNCHLLLSVEELPANLKLIRANSCTSMERLLNLSALKQIETLELRSCTSLTYILGLDELPALKVLNLTGCNSTLLANTFTKCLFKVYSEFGHPVSIYAPLAEFPGWFKISGNSNGTVSVELPPNVSHNFFGIIICLEYSGEDKFNNCKYCQIRNTKSDFVWCGMFEIHDNELLMVIVPRSIFSVRNGDDRIELTTYSWRNSQDSFTVQNRDQND